MMEIPSLTFDRILLIKGGSFDLPSIPAGEKGTISLPLDQFNIKGDNEIYLTVSLVLKQSTLWANAGHEVAWFQHRLHEPTSKSTSSSLNHLSSKLQVSTEGSVVKISGLNFVFTFDRARGSVKSWAVDGKEILYPDPKTGVAVIPSFWRPATDNDVSGSLPYWQRFGVDALTSQLRSFSIDSSDSQKTVLKAHTYLTPPVLGWGWNSEVEYTVYATGALSIDVARLSPTGPFPEHIPRVGLNLHGSEALEQVSWFGLGPGESYPDKKSAQHVGIWDVESVNELQIPYDVPQENGNRLETRWVKFGSRGAGLRASRVDEDSQFSFVASHHSTDTIQSARHPPDLVEDGAVHLRLDARVAGVGSGACGPAVREDLMVKTEEYKFKFLLEPL